MAKQERRIFDKDVQVWVHRYENLRNMAHWHFENELVVCQEGAAEIMLDGIFYTLHQGDCAFFCGERVHNIRGTVDRPHRSRTIWQSTSLALLSEKAHFPRPLQRL